MCAAWPLKRRRLCLLELFGREPVAGALGFRIRPKRTRAAWLRKTLAAGQRQESCLAHRASARGGVVSRRLLPQAMVGNRLAAMLDFPFVYVHHVRSRLVLGSCFLVSGLGSG